MATGGDLNVTDPQVKRRKLDGDLTDSQIEGLAREMEARKMESIAIADLGIGIETVNNLKLIRQGDYMGFIRDMLVLWRNKNPGINQVQRLADILYSAAEEGGLVDPNKIEQILKVPNPKNSATAAATATTAEETVTEAEFLDIAHKLKPHVERRMKIEPFPWLWDYYVDMNKLYTKLTLEKIENEVRGVSRRTLKGYKEMFKSDVRDKILTKGEPGMGKSTLAKKIGWDWTKGVLGRFSLILVVFLKSVQPDQPIEDVIIWQNPELKGIGVTAAKLRGILDRFGDRCLLILDGLDEHGLGKNEDVLNIIRNEKLLNCGIIVSSRPHATREIEIHFSTVIEVEGFNEEEAKRFVSNFFKDDKKINQVMLFKPSDSDYEFPIQKCPILLSFFCFLVAEKEIDLSEKKISMGDIYTRLVKCLYKKYTIRKGFVFDAVDFDRVMKSVGQLALKTLTSGNPLLQRREVLRVVGDFAFEYGLFAGHEDFRLVGDPTADNYVTYPHRSLEEFFGSYGFIDALSEGKSVDDILGSVYEVQIFMINLLVLRFCLWFLSSLDFDFRQRDECYDKLMSYVTRRIDDKVFDTEKIRNLYPAIDMLPSHSTLSSKYICDILDKCKHITILHLYDNYEFLDLGDVEHFFSLLNKDFIERLTTIIINHDHFDLKDTDNSSLTLSIRCLSDSEALEMTNLSLYKYNLSERNPQIYTTIAHVDREDHDITITSYIPSHELHIESSMLDFSLTASGEFPQCPILTHLTIDMFHVDESVPSELRKVINDGKLPNLRRVTLKQCCEPSSRLDWPDEVEVSVTNERSKDRCKKCGFESESESD